MTSISTAQTRIELHRQQFPALANKTYFNYGGQGPMPQVPMDAITQAQEHIQRSGPSSNGVNAWVTQEVQQTRAAIATELRVPPETITITEDVTVGCNIALWGIDWQAGDRLLLTDCEHLGVIAAAEAIGRRFGVEISTCPLMATLNGGDPAQAIGNLMGGDTKWRLQLTQSTPDCERRLAFINSGVVQRNADNSRSQLRESLSSRLHFTGRNQLVS